MPRIIRNREVVHDSWQLPDGEQGAIPADGDIFVNPEVWRAQRDSLLARHGRLGLCLGPTDEPETIADDLAHFSAIAIRFPKFTDGRGYSIARLLRERYAYAGEIRAIGDVLPDNLFYLSRCGFNAFALKREDQLNDALACLDDFSDGYQASVERPEPLFRRRLRADPA